MWLWCRTGLVAGMLAAAVASSGCGYALAGRGNFLPDYIRTIGIPTFQNHTSYFVLAELVTGFGSLPSMQVERIGYGAGTRDLKARPNMLRVLIGEAIRHQPRNAPTPPEIVVMETNLDNATGEDIGYAIERLFEAKALDVFGKGIG